MKSAGPTQGAASLSAAPRRFRIPLSIPWLDGGEAAMIADAIASNWITPLGPHVDAFESEFAERIGVPHAVALSSGTAALHLSLIHLGVGPGDEVLVSTLTFAATVNPIRYLGATPVFIDSEATSWNLDPDLLVSALDERARRGRRTRAVILVHLYGQSANLDPIVDACRRHGVALIEDAAEALGTTYQGRPVGADGWAAAFSFNGNKIITTSGGGMLVTADGRLADHARKLATQARDPAPHYQHTEVGYNYRLSNVLAAIGRAQLRTLDQRVESRRRHFDGYRSGLRDVPGITFMAEAPWGRHSRWLSTVTIDGRAFGIDREEVRLALAAEGIEARPVWKPMHLQPVFSDFPAVGGAVSEGLFRDGLCLPSSTQLTDGELDDVVQAMRRLGGH